MIMERFYIVLVQSCLLQYLVMSSSNFTDQFALLSFQSNINFDPTNTILGGNWTKTTNFCSWFGVSCSRRRQRVTALNLSNMDLQGTIPPQIGNLSFLVTLYLYNNNLYGSLPREIGHLHRLREIIMDNNQLEGQIPPSLNQCRELHVLSLTGNRLSGGIPEELGSLPQLREIFLGQNNLGSAIPSSLGNISTLQILVLTANRLTGSIPYAIFNISSLVDIDVHNNSVSGSLPMDLCLRCPNLQGLFLSVNQFSSQLPSSIGQCTELVTFSISFNGFHGSILKEIGNLQNLEDMYFGDNEFTGTIPSTIGNMSSLKVLDLALNNIEGSIPSELGHLPNLNILSLQMNGLSGPIPQEIFNISSLQVLSLYNNSLFGNLPLTAGVSLPNLQEIFLARNRLTGNIPSFISNFSELFYVDMGGNLLTGPIPASLGDLKRLRVLSLHANQLTGVPGDPELSFLAALSNCRFLERLILPDNPLNGIISDSVGNLSGSLQMFVADGCQIKGHLPRGIGSLKNLTLLNLRNNSLSGELPSTIGGLPRLQRLYLDNNKIEGSIPEEICKLTNLGILSLSNNQIYGSIPNCIGNISLLQTLLLGSNRLTSSIPVSLWSLENLLFLNVSFNFLSGDFPQNMRELSVIQNMDLSWNQISGNIPSTMGRFESLNSLNLSRNLFQGSIPPSFSDLRGLDFMDLSYNQLSGTIPKSLEALSKLKYLNLSFNNLSGEIPTGGPFENYTAQSFLGNKELCGNPILGVSPCTTQDTKKSKTRLLKYIVPAVASTVILISLIFLLLRKHQKNKTQIPRLDDILLATHPLISYEELRRGTNNFCESNLLGVGNFGSVYKGILSTGTTVAVKILNLQVTNAFKSFDAECKVLRTIRHRNLVKVISSCSNPELRGLVLQYMCNGSLEKWLYSHNYRLDLLQRVSIMVDVALAVEYLHHGQAEPVVHCDLKPNNILLDEDMVAHVGDFGIAKIMAANKDETQTKSLGTLGYIAPEYGSEGKVSTRVDVYSYGIMLLEIMTRKKPTDEMFFEELSLRQWVNTSLPNNIMEVTDNNILSAEEGNEIDGIEGVLLSIMELSMECTKEMAEERLDIKNVVDKLSKIKSAILQNRNSVA